MQTWFEVGDLNEYNSTMGYFCREVLGPVLKSKRRGMLDSAQLIDRLTGRKDIRHKCGSSILDTPTRNTLGSNLII